MRARYRGVQGRGMRWRNESGGREGWLVYWVLLCLGGGDSFVSGVLSSGRGRSFAIDRMYTKMELYGEQTSDRSPFVCGVLRRSIFRKRAIACVVR